MRIALAAAVAVVASAVAPSGADAARPRPERPVEPGWTLQPSGVRIRPARAVRDRLAPVPILMYHVISAPPAHAPYPDLYVPKEDFARQMAWLARNGYHAVTLRRVFDAWRGAVKLPTRPIVLSFDDGYLSHATNAFPVLQTHRWPGVLNLEFRNLKPVWGIRPPAVRRLIKAGWEIDAHTLTHPDLTTVSAEQLREEVAGSREAIRRMFGVPADFFCYPAGRFDDRVIAAVQAAGFLGATSTRYGLAKASELYTMARVRVNGDDGVAGLAAKLGALVP